MDTFYKDPSKILRYGIDWTDVIGSDSIVTSTWNVPSPLTNEGDVISGVNTFVDLGGGVAGGFYTVTNHIVTSGGEAYDDGFVIVCQPVSAVSGVSIFNVTRDDIIKLALQDIKVYAPDFEDPTPEAITRASVRLNMMIKAWQAAGVGLWLNSIYEMPGVVGATSYYIGPNGSPAVAKPLSVIECRLSYNNGDELPMMPISRQEYMMLPIKTVQGMPTQYYVDYQLDNLIFYVWETVSDVSQSFIMTLRRPVQDFQSLDNTPDFPIEWADALHYNLAARLVPAYDVPEKTAARVMELAGITLQDADGFDREQNVAIQLVPDSEW